MLTLPQPDFGGKKHSELVKRATFWYHRLFDMVMSMYEWQGLPDTINRDYLEFSLHTHGSVVWCRDNDGKLRALRSSHYGFDCYNFPTSVEIANPVLGNISREIGVNCVWMRNCKSATPTLPVISEFAGDLAQLDIDFRVNLNNIKAAKVFHVSSEPQAIKLRELYNKIMNGEPAVIYDGRTNLLADEDVEVFGGDVAYLGDKLLADRRTVINDFLTQFGVNNIALEKKERLITGEVGGNDQELAIMREFWLAPRREAAEKVNEMFGPEITVEMISPSSESYSVEVNDDAE